MEVAPAKKDGTATPSAANAGFFPVVKTGTGYKGEHAAAAGAKLTSVVDTLRAFHATAVRANVA
ncbi:MAG: hypothetical protein RRY63_06410 [Acidaminococcaceae bacterium]